MELKKLLRVESRLLSAKSQRRWSTGFSECVCVFFLCVCGSVMCATLTPPPPHPLRHILTLWPHSLADKLTGELNQVADKLMRAHLSAGGGEGEGGGAAGAAAAAVVAAAAALGKSQPPHHHHHHHHQNSSMSGIALGGGRRGSIGGGVANGSGELGPLTALPLN